VENALSNPEGVLVSPAEPSGTGVLVLSGSSGRIEAARCRVLAAAGATAVSVRWFGGPGQQPQPYEVPLETFTGTLDLLAAFCRRIAVLGSSFGAQAALLLAALDERIDAVIALAPSPVVWGGREQTGSGNSTQVSQWTSHGAPLPFVPVVTDWTPHGDPPVYRELYERSLASCPAGQIEAATIAVERISGELILVGGEDDQVWPGADFARMVAARRAAHGLDSTVVTHRRAGHRVVLPGEEPVAGGPRLARGGSARFDAELGSLAWGHILAALHLSERRATGR
jgi:dienelactone hydrolase